MKKIILKKGRENSIERRHPWIFSGAVHRLDDDLEEGDIVAITDFRDQHLAIAHYQNSSITARIISFQEVDVNASFWLSKIEAACQLRQTLSLTENSATNCYRLINGEGDGMSGLILDIYGSCAVIQCHSVGMYRNQISIAEAITKIFGNRIDTIYCKNRLPIQVDTDGFLLGDRNEAVVLENGLKFHVNWVEGQKTGFFLDQRNNRQLVKQFASGRKVLNAYCYTGGFSVYAMEAGALSVDSVDVSQKAIDLTTKNIKENFSSQPIAHEKYTADVMHYLKDCEKEYDLMILDPPAFAKSQKKRHNAIQAYKRLNALAFSKINSGGIVFTFSCSQVVDTPLFVDTIRAAAIEANRRIQILQYLSQPADHPSDIFHPEGTYLKGLVLKIT